MARIRSIGEIGYIEPDINFKDELRLTWKGGGLVMSTGEGFGLLRAIARTLHARDNDKFAKVIAEAVTT